MGRATTTNGEQSFTTKGIIFTIPAPYGEGHEINADEAGALNQTFSENVRNNTNKLITTAFETAVSASRGLTDDEILELQSKVSTYAADYTFSGRRATKSPLDPVLKEATKLARAAIKAQLAKKNLEVADERMASLVAMVLDQRPWFKEEAARRIAAQKEAALDSLDGLAES